VQVAHAAFLTTPVHLDVASPAAWDSVWNATPRRDTHHGLADLRAILDHPELFDVINIHNLGDPYEIEHIMRWLRWETERRGYQKPVIISDTTPTSYIAWGPATICTGRALGVMTPPATEQDRCRLARYFSRLVAKDRATVAWTRGFVAADHVQRAVIAAEQGIRLINLAFVADIEFATTPLFRAGAGISAWGGALRIRAWDGQVLERYPAFHAIRQLMGHLQGYRSISRVSQTDPHARVYRIEGRAGVFWVAWRDPMGVLLPEDGRPSTPLRLQVDREQVSVEPVVTAMGNPAVRPQVRQAPGGRLALQLTHTPVYILP